MTPGHLTPARLVLPLVATALLVVLIHHAYAYVLAPIAQVTQPSAAAPHDVLADGARLRVVPPKDGTASSPAHRFVPIAPIALNLPLLVLFWGWFVPGRPRTLLALAALLIATHAVQASLEVRQQLGTLPADGQGLLRFWQGTGWILLPLLAGTIAAFLSPGRPTALDTRTAPTS
jgi:hypothetical protein